MANILHIDRLTNKITLGTTGTTINIASHTASLLLGLDASKNLESVDLSSVYQPLDASLTSIAGLTYASDSFIKVTAEDTYAIRTIAETKTDLSLNLVENTALLTWAGSANITTLGTITTVGNITITDGGTIGPAALPLINFNETLGRLQIQNTDGLLELRNVLTDTTNKSGRVVVSHYDNTEEPLYAFGAVSTATDNFLALGGGSTLGNVATRIQLFTAADTTTVTGTKRMEINSTHIEFESDLKIKEQAAASVNIAAYGQIWCKTATPNQLWFVNDVGTEVRIAPQDLQITASPQFVKIGLGISPNNRVHIQTIATEGMAGLFINQVDDDQPFIEYYGNSAADTTRPITSLTAGNSIQGFVRTHINGTDYWMPYYDAPTS